jgi:hypothetical protein
MFQPENSFVELWWNRARSHVNERHELKAFWQTSDSFPSHSPPLHSRSIKQGYKDCWHLVKALESAPWRISHCIFNREWVEKRPTSDFPQSGWIFSQVFACHMSCVILADIIQTVLETSESFLFNTRCTAEHLIHPSYSILPPAIRS